MKKETHIIILKHRTEAERIEGSVFGTMEEVKKDLANDGVELIGSYKLHEFAKEWNNTEDDYEGLRYDLDWHFISYIYITK